MSGVFVARRKQNTGAGFLNLGHFLDEGVPIVVLEPKTNEYFGISKRFETKFVQKY